MFVKSLMVLVLWGMIMLVVLIMGLIFGGWIFDNMSWLWIFYINILVGVFVVYVIWVIYKDCELLICVFLIDKIGLVLLILWVGLF